ncbi:hypothetical protein LZ31DRAFT_548221 [Colletotrichum somersetense]|nr:hypothetical protein LZ31DRAFT_548221 [Colletotrichum somersetense]
MHAHQTTGALLGKSFKRQSRSLDIGYSVGYPATRNTTNLSSLRGSQRFLEAHETLIFQISCPCPVSILVCPIPIQRVPATLLNPLRGSTVDNTTLTHGIRTFLATLCTCGPLNGGRDAP